MALGGLITAISGPCTLVCGVGALTSGRIDSVLMVLMVGGIPFMFGMGLWTTGRHMCGGDSSRVSSRVPLDPPSFTNVAMLAAPVVVALVVADLNSDAASLSKTDFVFGMAGALFCAVFFKYGAFVRLRMSFAMNEWTWERFEPHLLIISAVAGVTIALGNQFRALSGPSGPEFLRAAFFGFGGTFACLYILNWARAFGEWKSPELTTEEKREQLIDLILVAGFGISFLAGCPIIFGMVDDAAWTLMLSVLWSIIAGFGTYLMRRRLIGQTGQSANLEPTIVPMDKIYTPALKNETVDIDERKN